MKAKKYDQEKPDFCAIPQLALLEVAKTFTHGKKKYGLYNYSLGMDYTRYISAAQRHLNKALRGIDIDEDSGRDKLYHLSNAISSIMMCLDNQLSGTLIDNRNKIYKKKRNDKM